MMVKNLALEGLSDEELAVMVTPENGSAAFEVLDSRYRRKVITGLSLQLNPGYDIDSACQEVMIKLYNALTSGLFNPSEAKLSTYLWRIVRNHTIDERRKKATQNRGLEVFAQTYQEWEEPEINGEDHVMLDSLKDAIENLPDGYREVVKLRLLEVPHKEIARRIGISSRVSRWRYVMAKNLIRDYIIRVKPNGYTSPFY